MVRLKPDTTDNMVRLEADTTKYVVSAFRRTVVPS